MRMKLPENITSFGWGGEEYKPDPEGIIEIHEDAQAEALRHGLVEVGPLPEKSKGKK
jgi:hypothetical protein